MTNVDTASRDRLAVAVLALLPIVTVFTVRIERQLAHAARP